MKKWQVKFVPQSKNKQKRQQEVIDFLLLDRGIKDKNTFFNPPRPSTLTPGEVGIKSEDITRAHQQILVAQKDKKKILVWGDYDADGITGTALLWESLWKAGFKALPFIPDRIDGYGLNVESFKKIYQADPQIGLIITVDNGIVANQEIEAINHLGVDVLITDHHAQGKKLPQAKAVLWSDQVCGATVAWFLAREIAQKNDYALDLLALATVADMIPLVGPNRGLVKYGLTAISQTDRVGLKALMTKAGINQTDLSVYHLGFLLSPRLNAMGRLYNAMDSLRLLCTTDSGRAEKLAQKLESANQERQSLTFQTLETIDELLDEAAVKQNKLIFVTHPSFQAGIIGLAAGRLTERFYRPSVVLSEEDGFFRASCRSIKGFNIIQALKTIDGLIDVGGHPLAAGFVIKKEDLDRVKNSLLSLANKTIADSLLAPQLDIDTQLNFSDLDRNFYQKIADFHPFGLGNPEPLFYTDRVLVRDCRRVGRQENHLKLVLDDLETKKIEETAAFWNEGEGLAAIGFGLGDKEPKIGEEVEIVYNLMINHYRGQDTLELKIKDLRPCRKTKSK
jgi:single-stranded-DNA-specific exonuclease